MAKGVDDAVMGRRLRELRTERGISQSHVAKALEISPAYLSLLEQGKRSMQLPILVEALEIFDVSVDDFMASLGTERVDEGLASLLDEPLFRSLKLGEKELDGLAATPLATRTITTLFNLYKTTRQRLERVQGKPKRNEHMLAADYHPFDEVTDFLEEQRNYFPTLEARAEEFRVRAGLGTRSSAGELVEALVSRFGVHVELTEDESVIRRFSPGSGKVALSARMPDQRLRFQLAHVAALLVFDRERLHEEWLARFESHHAETPALIKMHLANYFAGAVLLPYGRFHEEVVRERYDIEILARRFDTSYETVAHRICNLGDPERPGVPMHFFRVDVAGNISKRYAGDGVPLAHHGGSCPKRTAHLAFLTPNAITKQFERFPDGSTYFCFAKVVSESKGGSISRGTAYAIGLGCEARYADRFAYADDLPRPRPADRVRVALVGPTCRFCERPNCNMRSAPSYRFAFRVDEDIKKDNFFSPIVDTEERES